MLPIDLETRSIAQNWTRKNELTVFIFAASEAETRSVGQNTFHMYNGLKDRSAWRVLAPSDKFSETEGEKLKQPA